MRTDGACCNAHASHLLHEKCPASPEKENQRAAGSPAALTQLALI
jgi:hypothetical protein